MNSSPQKSPGWMTRTKRLKELLIAFSAVIRLVLAFACGWFLALLVARSASAALLFVAFPPFLGVMATWTVGRRNPNLLALSLGTGLLVVVGIYTYWLPIVLQHDAETNAFCATHYCHVSGIELSLLTLFLLYAIVVVLLGSAISSFMVKRSLKRETREPLSESRHESSPQSKNGNEGENEA
ncbi:MAG: hypothetical protein NVS2B2_37440 [Ktedonobacteraceae bacterium]